MKNSSNPKVAFVYDRVNTAHGGAEKVLLALHKIFPEAPLYTSVYDPEKANWAKIFKIKTSFLQKIPFSQKLHRWIAPLMPIAFESLDLSNFDIVISVTSAEAKGVITNHNQLHICYLLTPTRYLYQDREAGLEASSILSLPVIKWFSNQFLNYLTWWDQVAITRPDMVVPISERVADRVKKYYPNVKPSPVIYPPVESTPSTNSRSENKDYFLIVSRLVSYKKIELAIEACSRSGKKLIIVGSGPEKNKLKNLTRKLKVKQLISFLKNISAGELQKLYLSCKAVIIPGEEDFGIVALEANAYGKPVLINQKSGAAELIENNESGVYITQESVTGVLKAIKELEEKNFSYEKIIQNSQKYGTNVFTEKFSQLVKREWKNKVFRE